MRDPEDEKEKHHSPIPDFSTKRPGAPCSRRCCTGRNAGFTESEGISSRADSGWKAALDFKEIRPARSVEHAGTTTALAGRTFNWTFNDGPTAGKTYEHKFAPKDGTVTFREAGAAEQSGVNRRTDAGKQIRGLRDRAEDLPRVVPLVTRIHSHRRNESRFEAAARICVQRQGMVPSRRDRRSGQATCIKHHI